MQNTGNLNSLAEKLRARTEQERREMEQTEKTVGRDGGLIL